MYQHLIVDNSLVAGFVLYATYNCSTDSQRLDYGLSTFVMIALLFNEFHGTLLSYLKASENLSIVITGEYVGIVDTTAGNVKSATDISAVGSSCDDENISCICRLLLRRFS